MGRQRLSCMDSMRGFACLIVIFAHIAASDATYGAYASGCGKIGVWLFMLMSGFLSFLPYVSNLKRLDKLQPKYVLDYYKKKIVRLYPVYVIALILALVLGFITSWKDVVKSMLAMEGIGHFWYMPVILKFYLVFPLVQLLWQAVHKSRKIFSVIMLALGVIVGIIFPFNRYIENSIQLRWYIPVFVMGILLSVVYVKCREHMERYMIFDVMSLVSVIFILFFTPLARKLIFGIEPSGWLQNKYLLMGALWSVFLFGVLFGKYLEKFLEKCRVLQWIGGISYELYLFHYLVLFELRKFGRNTLVNGLLTILISILLSFAVNKILDVLGHRLEEYRMQ